MAKRQLHKLFLDQFIHSISSPMLLNYIKIAVRHLFKHKSFSFINIAGLAVGMTGSLFILLWLQDELSFDRFHADAENIYRANIHLVDNNLKGAVTCPPIAEAAQREIVGVQSTIRLTSPMPDLLQVDDKVFEETSVMYADSNFFEFFTFSLIKGDAKNALSRPENIVLTEQMAIKYFGTTDVVGKTITKPNKNEVFNVSGVMAAIPGASHLKFDFVEPMSFYAKYDRDLVNHSWDNFNYFTYIKTEKPLGNHEVAEFDSKLTAIYRKNETGLRLNVFLQPMTDIHLTPGLLADVPGVTDKQYVYIFGLVGILVLAVACINFMNLATARSARRAKEVGLRKVAGAFRTQLIIQFMSESMVIAGVALLLSLIMTSALLPALNELTGKTLTFDILDPVSVGGMAAIIVTVGFLSGSYPALLLSRFIPVKVLKGELAQGGGGKRFRHTMVALQFAISIVLLVGTTVIFQQMQFISQRNIGYDKANLVYVPLKGDLNKDADRLHLLLGQHTSTGNFTFASNIPTNFTNGTFNVNWDGKDPNAQPLFPNLAVDENFIDVFKMTLLAGRSFSRDIKADTANYIVNEQALKVMNMTVDNAVGKNLSLFGIKGMIVGVVKDFNFKTVQTAVEPMIMQFNPGYGYVVLRSEPNGLKQTLSDLESICKLLNPMYPFAYQFVDKDLERMYQSEQRAGQLFTVFAGLGLFISCLGLYGLSAFYG